jgi:hypothetical protein
MEGLNNVIIDLEDKLKSSEDKLYVSKFELQTELAQTKEKYQNLINRKLTLTERLKGKIKEEK